MESFLFLVLSPVLDNIASLPTLSLN
ncbi:rCG52264 [Rattus norvegicus]|uniref:RCG52264 n=1 Tax=Rattus norvegicus TaxID=10116 RepID=A6KUA1_RAT|nr:rCG52264 [Rattus norvegicus]